MGTERKTRQRQDPRGAKQGELQEWQLQEAKARFSEVFRLARERGPQRVTKHGREAVVIIPAEEYAQILAAKRSESLVEFFANSPLRDSGIDLERVRDYGREVDL